MSVYYAVVGVLLPCMEIVADLLPLRSDVTTKFNINIKVPLEPLRTHQRETAEVWTH